MILNKIFFAIVYYVNKHDLQQKKNQHCVIEINSVNLQKY